MKNILRNSNIGFTKWCVALIAAGWVGASSAKAQNVYWDFATATPTSGVPSGISVGAVSQGNNNGTTTLLTTTSVSSAYTGASGTSNAGAAARVGALNTASSGSAYFEFTITPNSGFSFTISAISFGSRSTSSGPVSYSLRSSTDSYGSDLTTGSLGTATSAWTLRSSSGLSINQSVATTYRIYGYGGAGTANVNTANWRIDDLKVTMTATGTTPSFTVTLNPSTVQENGGLNASSGSVTVSVAPSSDLVVSLSSGNPACATVPSSVTILAGQTSATFGVTVVQNSSSYDDQSSLITASASNYTSGTETLKVTNTDKRPMTVVINKFINATPDKAELLVVGNSTPGQTVDMRGMIFKDFSGNMAGDGGAQYTFTTSTLWAAVPVGTLIVLSNDNTAGDTDPADFKLGVGLSNTLYFTKTGGTFDIAATEMLMVKVAGSSAAGTSGGIHALASGTAGNFYRDFVGYKLIATGTTGTDQGVYANNSLGVLMDFDGTDATGSAVKTDAALTFGAASTAGNATFIASLRGTDPTDGSGAVTLANSTAGSSYALSPIFPREATGQSVSLNLTGILADKTISDVTVLVPELFGLPLAGNVTLTGTGAGSAVVTVNGQLITVTGAAVTTTASMTINVSGLSTPALANLSSNLGNLPFTVSTARAGGLSLIHI